MKRIVSFKEDGIFTLSSNELSRSFTCPPKSRENNVANRQGNALEKKKLFQGYKPQKATEKIASLERK